MTRAASSVELAGIDGCRGGWVAAIGEFQDGEPAAIRLVARARFSDMLHITRRSETVAVDMPIGLPDRYEPGGRECDREARRALGRPRSSSVFSPPARPLLSAGSFDEVRGKGLSLQAFHLLPRIREVDEEVNPSRQNRIHETHPELVFLTLMGEPMKHSKKCRKGREERIEVLRTHHRAYSLAVQQNIDRSEHAHGVIVAPDDRVDALVLLASARRQWEGCAERFPQSPGRDRRGLRMEIWA